jgi:uncharacterized protein (DUF1919 family)
MRITFIRKIEKKIKGRFNRFRLKQTDFTIISNNCWGTFIYKKFNLPYQSPFVNLLIFADDYLNMLENFSPKLFSNISFISHAESKHRDELIARGYFNLNYPIGIIGDKIEIHFLHYENEDDAKAKWLDRVKRINYDKLLFKFSDSEVCTEEHIKRFDALTFNHKICFSAKPYSHSKSSVYLPHFKNENGVKDEWKYSEKEYDLLHLLNHL